MKRLILTVKPLLLALLVSSSTFAAEKSDPIGIFDLSTKPKLVSCNRYLTFCRYRATLTGYMTIPGAKPKDRASAPIWIGLYDEQRRSAEIFSAEEEPKLTFSPDGTAQDFDFFVGWHANPNWLTVVVAIGSEEIGSAAAANACSHDMNCHPRQMSQMVLFPPEPIGSCWNGLERK